MKLHFGIALWDMKLHFGIALWKQTKHNSFMGFFDRKWIVTFEYSNGFFSFDRNDVISVMASSESSAKDKAKSILKTKYKFFRIIDVIDEEKQKEAMSSNSDDNKRIKELEEKTKRLEHELWLNSLSKEEREEILRKEDEDLKKLSEEFANDDIASVLYCHEEKPSVRKLRLKRNWLLIPSIFTGMLSFLFVFMLFTWLSICETSPFEGFALAPTLWLLSLSILFLAGTVLLIVYGIKANNKLKKEREE